MSFRYEDVEKIYNKIKKMKQKGKNADYIPDLKKGNPNIYAISVCNIKGEIMNFGDYESEVSIQSVSKVFTLALALNIHSIKKLILNIGNTKEKHEFNSMEDVIHLKNHTINSFVNAGAMATTSLLYDKMKSKEDNEKTINKLILENMGEFAGRKLKVNEHVYLSERHTNEHNKHLIDKLVSYNRFYGDPEIILKTYTRQCSVMVSSKDIAVMAATLANNSTNPITHKKILSEEKTDYIKASREAEMAAEAAARAKSDPKFDPTNRPAAPPADDKYVYYYGWIGGAGTGQWKLYSEPKTNQEKAAVAETRATAGATSATFDNVSGANTVKAPVTAAPTPAPTASPTPAPTAAPTAAPTVTPTPSATGMPTATPTATPKSANLVAGTTTTAPLLTTVSPTTAPTALTYKANDGTVFTDQAAYVNYQKMLTDKATATAATDAANTVNRQSAYDLMYAEFSKYGLGSLVQPLQGLIQSGASPSEFSIKLRESDAYKKRFSANDQRVSKGLKAISEAEYIGLEDQYQNILRNAGLPESYWKQSVDPRTGIVSQEGFANFIANDVSAVELEDRVATAQQRLIYANPEVSIALKTFYPDITNGDLLAYTLDPTKGLEQIKRRITAAEVGSSAVQMGLATNVTDAEYLARYGVNKAQAQQGYGTIAGGLQRGSQLASIYGENPYTQTTAEQEVFNVPGAAEARKQRQKITGLERATFGGQSGLSQGALARDRAGGF